jgi:hypothetical protein
MKNLLFHLKAVKRGTYKAQVGAGAGAGAESNSFGSATLSSIMCISLMYLHRRVRYL